MSKKDLVNEVLHFQEISSLILPRTANFPILENIDYHAVVEPCKGCVGGDHLMIVNFEEYNLSEKIEKARVTGDKTLESTLSKNKDKFGILLVDSSGHMITDHVTNTFIHSAFKTGIAYELKYKGEVTADIIEMLNTMVYNRNSLDFLKEKPYATLLYGEINNDGIFRFVLAGHHPPKIFSREYNSIVSLGKERTLASTPLGTIPSKFHVDIENFGHTIAIKEDYVVNEIRLLGKGDILLLYSDLLLEQEAGDKNYSESRLENLLREVKDKSARDIYLAIRRDVENYAPITDDFTLVVVKKR
jgi:serine phosphatase RsbU (regulator of sigma subunit)